MNPQPRAKEMLLRLLSNYEALYVENHVLKCLLSTCEIPAIRDTWKEALETVRQLPDVQHGVSELHASFDELRAQVLAAIDADLGARQK
jgi:hypothetical protein